MYPLTINNLTKIFTSQTKWFRYFYDNVDSYVAIKNISFSLKEGEIIGLIGTNGAGKTTLMHMLMGILTPTSGSIYYFGKDFSNHRSTLLQDISFASSSFRLASSLTVMQNLKFFAKIYTMPQKTSEKKINELLDIFDLTDYKYTKISDLSAGQANKTVLLKAFLPEAKIILLDEPTAFLDFKTATIVRDLIKNQRAQWGTTFLLTSHNQQDISELCDTVLILEHGSIREDSSQTYLKAQKDTAKNARSVFNNEDPLGKSN